MPWERLVFRQSSMQFSDSRAQWREDLEAAVPAVVSNPDAPDFIGFTELGNPQDLALVAARCTRTGYLFHRHGSVGLAVHPKHTVLDVGRIDVLPGFRSPSGKGSHQPRGVLEVTVETPWGNEVTDHVAHWVTDGGRNAQRAAKRTKQSVVIAGRVERNGRGRALSFWQGDTNEDEERGESEVQKPLTRRGLVSIYDALDVYPATHGRRTIDVIGHYKRDRRVRPKAVDVHRRRHSDHRVVDAVYEVKSPRRR